MKTVKYFLNLDFIIENVPAKDEMADIINLEEIIYFGQTRSYKQG